MTALIVVSWVVLAAFTGAIAESKGRSSKTWLVLGACFGPVAFISVGMMPVVTGAPASIKACQACSESISFTALKCRYCGTDQPERVAFRDASQAR